MNVAPLCPKAPRHVAIIMDGNGRWASQRKPPRYAGHKAGLESIRRIVKACLEHRIEALTLFAFSSENWSRPEKEVGMLMGLFVSALEQEVRKLHKYNVRLRIIGNRSGFNSRLRRLMAEAERLTHANTGLHLVIAANYGGRWDITEAARTIACGVAGGELRAEDISPELLGSFLSISDLPDPDLLIRTGKEQRVSNFLLWQLAYAELYFTDVLWPDFGREAFERSLAAFASRQRRFGGLCPRVDGREEPGQEANQEVTDDEPRHFTPDIEGIARLAAKGRDF